MWGRPELGHVMLGAGWWNAFLPSGLPSDAVARTRGYSGQRRVIQCCWRRRGRPVLALGRMYICVAPTSCRIRSEVATQQHEPLRS